MRFMIIVKSTEQAEAGIPPDSADLAAMGRFNEKLIDAGILLGSAGQRPPAGRGGTVLRYA